MRKLSLPGGLLLCLAVAGSLGCASHTSPTTQSQIAYGADDEIVFANTYAGDLSYHRLRCPLHSDEHSPSAYKLADAAQRYQPCPRCSAPRLRGTAAISKGSGGSTATDRSGGSYSAADPNDPEKTVHVSGYTKKDGTYVKAHNRRPPAAGSDKKAGKKVKSSSKSKSGTKARGGSKSKSGSSAKGGSKGSGGGRHK